MYTEDIKALAQAQKDERKARNEKKATKTSPLPDDYQAWFISSDARRRDRANQIRTRHLLAAYKSGRPYKVVEATTKTDLYYVHYWLCSALSVLEPDVDHSADLLTWLDLKPSYRVVGKSKHMASCLGFEAPRDAVAA
jgi:hypothetical protein